MATRRRVVQAAVGGMFALLPSASATPRLLEPSGKGVLDPGQVDKYVTPLVVPPVMPRAGGGVVDHIDHYVIGVRQFQQQVLPSGLPATTVWGYGSTSHPRSFHYPAFTVEARAGTPVRVRWKNQLLDRKGRYLPHLLPVDPTLHWANPPGGTSARDSRPGFRSTPGPYAGPVPVVTHLHGGRNSEESDGYTEAWYLPGALDLPAGYAEVGSFYEEFKEKFEDRFGDAWGRGTLCSSTPTRIGHRPSGSTITPWASRG